MNDESLMPFGVHKGKQLADVPAKYLIFIYDEGYRLGAELQKYIEENRKVLEVEIKRQKS